MSKEKKAYKLHNYSNDDLEKALKQVKQGVSIGKAAESHGVPKSTLHAKVTGRIPEKAKRGPQTVLTSEEEERLTKWILDKAKLGFPMHPDEVKNAVQRVLREVPRENTFIDNRPGDKWFKLFLSRHQEVTIKQAEVISKGRASVTEDRLRGWFREVISHLEEVGASSVLTRPECIFNGDETGVQLCPKSGRLLGRKGEKDFYEIASGKEKETMTVLCTFSAAGVALPPMILFPYKRIPLLISESVPDHWPVGRSDSGWMVSQTFYEYITGHFYPWCIENGMEFPVIYFLDGHKSHLSLELSDFCVKHNIILYCLYPNSTHITQPCDVSVFRGLKYKWKVAVLEYKQTTQKSLTKYTFARIFEKAFIQITEESIKNGFKICGLFPFDENAVNYDKCISTRRQGLSQTAADVSTPQDSQDGPLTRDDYLSTAKFFRHTLGDETVQEFTHQRSTEESCDDPVYVLWETCMNKLENDFMETEPGPSDGADGDSTEIPSSSAQSRPGPSNTAGEDAPEIHDDGVPSPRFPNVLSSNPQGVMNVQTQVKLKSLSNSLEIPLFNAQGVCASPNINLCDLDDTIIIEFDDSLTSPINCDGIIDLSEVGGDTTSPLDDKETESSKDDENASNIRDIDEGIDNKEKNADTEHEVPDDNSNELNNNNIQPESLVEATGDGGDGSSKSTSEAISSTAKKGNSSNGTQRSASHSKGDISKALLWPEPEGVGKVKRKQKESLPSALTAAGWREHHIKLKEDKIEKELNVKKRMQERLQKKEEAELKKIEARVERERKKEEKLRMKKEEQAVKCLMREQKLRIKQEKEAEKVPGKRSRSKGAKSVEEESISDLGLCPED